MRWAFVLCGGKEGGWVGGRAGGRDGGEGMLTELALLLLYCFTAALLLLCSCCSRH
jgi:hypothetical protein